MIITAYLDHLTTGDLSLLGSDGRHVADKESTGELIRSQPGALDELLRSEHVFDAVFNAPKTGKPLLAASPFFVFAVAVHRAASQLESASYVSEWLSLGRRAPVFDAVQLSEFLAMPWHRLFLTELLASYTHVTSGSVVVSTRRGLRRQRFSELDPVRLAALLEVVSDAERPGVLRRLGDLALFLTGVFPDYVARRGFGPIEEGRLLRTRGIARGTTGLQSLDLDVAATGDRGAVGLLEQLGRHWYRSAFELLPRPVAENVAVLGEMSDRFDQARRILGYISEHILFSHRDRWFGLANG